MPAPKTLHRVFFLAGFVVLIDVAALILALVGNASCEDVAAARHEDAASADTRGRQAPARREAPPISAEPARATLASHARPVEPLATSFDPDGHQVRRFERVSRALELLRFPPDSQPLRADMLDVLRPGARYETPVPLAGGLALLFTANTYAVSAGRPIVATLEVFRESGARDRRPVPVQIRSCKLARFAQPEYLPLSATLSLNDDGRDADVSAGDGIYTVSLVPSALPELASYNGLLRLDVELGRGAGARRVEGDASPARAALDFRLTSAPPAAFVGIAGERLTNDGLELVAELEVREAGRYFVQGLLFDSSDRPLGIAVARPSLEVGRAMVPLLYWGLLFHEANAVGSFTFRTLTGHRLPDAGEADRTDIASWEGSYRTRSYALGEFSEKEHESAAKSRKVQALVDLAAQSPKRAAPTE
jgi:hypothetical protein